jgi:hypothetical protein
MEPSKAIPFLGHERRRRLAMQICPSGALARATLRSLGGWLPWRPRPLPPPTHFSMFFGIPALETALLNGRQGRFLAQLQND